MRLVIIGLVVVLLIAHQDYWNWNDSRLVMGFLPVGLFYHLGISLAASAVWILAVTWAWPKTFTFSESDSNQPSQPLTGAPTGDVSPPNGRSDSTTEGVSS